MLNIAIDACGGDLGPEAVVEGAARASREFSDIRLTLVGPSDTLGVLLKKYPIDAAEILPASEVITPDETPTLAIRRKKNSSIVVGLNEVKSGRAHAFVSAGSTGALLTGATVIIGRRTGIERPALATLLPTPKGHTLLVDCGANMDSKPSYLKQFAEIGAEYVTKSLGIENPSVGLINVGTEEEKGCAVVKEAFQLLGGSELNFVGNIEGRDVTSGEVNVAVCDGFVGNVLLKVLEGTSKTLMGMMKTELMARTITKLGALLAKGAFVRLRKRFDYREVGGAPFLGLNKLVIKAHGSSDALAIKNAIRQCIVFEQKGGSHGV